jgi:hypothetical protein
MKAEEEKVNDKEILAKALQKASTLHEFKSFEEARKPNMPVLLLMGLAGIALIAYFAKSENYLASFLLFLAGITVVLSIVRREKNPKPLVCKIKSQGVQVARELYPYENLKSFWIFYDPPYRQELSIRLRNALASHVRIPLGDEDPVKIRELLLKFIPERKQEEALVDVFARIVGL